MENQAPDRPTMAAIVEMFNQGRYSEAEGQLRELTQRYPRHGFGWKILGPVLHMLGRPLDALAAMQKTVELAPNDAEAHNNLGKALSDQGRFADAEQSYLRAVALEPELALAHNNLGAVLADQGRPAEAEACYRRALELQPASAMAHGNLGNALRAQGRFADAETSYRSALTLDSLSADAHNNLGNALRDLGRAAEAETCFRRAIERNPAHAAAHNNLGGALRDQNRHAEAEASFRKALELNPAFAIAHNNLGNMLRDKGQFTEAEACYRKAVELDPESVDANVSLSVTLNHLVPAWHVPMMNDALRNEAYFDALRRAVTPDSNVLEIGTGSGLLAMLAARLGAHDVVTCEAVPLIASAARDIVAKNGLQKQVRVIAKKSTDIVVGADLPQRANVLVSEILSSELLGEGVLSSIEDAKKRLLAPGSKIIPATGSVMFALFGGEDIRKHARVDEVLGLDLRGFNAIAAPKRIIYRNDLDIEFLTAATEAFTFDFVKGDYFPAEKKTLRVPVTAAGLCYGVAQWIRLGMDGQGTFENHPAIKSPASGWQTCLYRFAEPVEIRAGQTARIRAAHNRTDVWFFWDGLE